MSTTTSNIKISQLNAYTNAINDSNSSKVLIPVSIDIGNNLYSSFSITGAKLSSYTTAYAYTYFNISNYDTRIKQNDSNIDSLNKGLGSVRTELQAADTTLQTNIDNLDTKFTDENKVLTEAVAKNRSDINNIITNRNSLEDITANSLNVSSIPLIDGNPLIRVSRYSPTTSNTTQSPQRPAFIGQIWIQVNASTSTKSIFIGIGTSSPSDWVQLNVLSIK